MGAGPRVGAVLRRVRNEGVRGVTDSPKVWVPQLLVSRPWMRELFGHKPQFRVGVSKHRFRAVTCSRRAGKTVLLAALGADALERCGHDEAVVYVARTRQIAKDLIWAKMRRLAITQQPLRFRDCPTTSSQDWELRFSLRFQDQLP